MISIDDINVTRSRIGPLIHIIIPDLKANIPDVFHNRFTEGLSHPFEVRYRGRPERYKSCKIRDQKGEG